MRIASWVTPPLALTAVYWLGLKAWFQQDDFAWLHLRLEIETPRDFIRLLFEPRAQGTIRPLSERLFFIVFSSLFGLDALPFRIWVFLTQFANLTLLNALVWRLTGSRLAGWLAALLWIANSSLAKVMSWTSAYNQALCGLFLLASLYLFVRYVQTGRRRYWVWQWVSYLVGFGSQELMVVYPALAGAYALCCARSHFRRSLPLWIPALIYAAVHQWAAPAASGGTYGLYFDRALTGTFATYWMWALTACYFQPVWLARALTGLFSVALGWFVVARWRRKDRMPAFFLLWFLIVIAPVAPLREHITEYYVMLPALGVAMLAGAAVASALAGRWWRRVVALGWMGAYVAVSLPATRTATEWNYQRSRAVRGMVRGVARANQLHPGKVILLVGVENDLFWTGVFDQPFRLVGRNSVFLAPESEAEIRPHPEYGDHRRFILPPGAALRALEEGQLVVYSVEPDRLRNITRVYAPLARLRWEFEEPRQVDVGEPIFARQLGPGWYSIQGRHRWTGKRAVVRLGGPQSPDQRLHLEGYCPAERLREGPVRMRLWVDGTALPEVIVHRPNQWFRSALPMPRAALGKEVVEVAIEVERTFRVPGDGRELGMVFGRFAVR